MNLYYQDSIHRAQLDQGMVETQNDIRYELRDQNFGVLSKEDTLKYTRLVELDISMSKLHCTRQAKVMNI